MDLIFSITKHFSIVLLALVPYDYKIIYADVGCQGRISNDGIYRNSSVCNPLSNGTLNLPRPRPMTTLYENHLSRESETKEIPFVSVADDAFPLTVIYALRDLDDQKRIFNFRLSRI